MFAGLLCLLSGCEHSHHALNCAVLILRAAAVCRLSVLEEKTCLQIFVCNIDALLCEGDSGVGISDQYLGQLHCPVKEIFQRNDLFNKTDTQCFLGGDLHAGHKQTLCLTHTDYAGKSCSAAAVGGETEADLRQGETGVVCCDTDIGAQYHLETGAGAKTLYSRDDRIGLGLPEAVKALHPVDSSYNQLRIDLLQIVEVNTGGEALALGAEDQAVEIVQSGQIVLELIQLHIESLFKNVIRRAVELENANALFLGIY